MKKHLKKLLLPAILLLLFASCFILSATAEPEPDYVFNAGTGALTVNTEAGVSKWLDDGIEKSAVLSVVIGSDIPRLDDAVFAEMENLESVECKGTIILNRSFSGCKALKSVKFDGTSKLKNTAFAECPDIESITFGGATALTGDAFTTAEGSRNAKLTELVFPAGSTFTADLFFSHYNALESVTFAGDVEIGGGNFSYCPALTTVIFNGTSKVTDGAFQFCQNLKSITFGGPTALSGSAFLTDGGNPNAKLTELTFPAGSTFTTSSFFMFYKSLASVTFAGDVEIGGGNFSYCPALTTVIFNGTSKVKDGAFSYCQNLTSISFAGPTNLSGNAFAVSGGNPNAKLTELTFPAGSAFETNGFFEYYSALASVTFAGDVEVGGSNFSYCPALTTVTFKGTSKVKGSAFSYCQNLTSISFAGPTNISDSAFSMGAPNEKLTTLTFPAGSTLAPNSFFSGYQGLKSVTFAGDVEVGGSDFSNCSALTTVTFKGTSKVKNGAFSNCPSLTIIAFAGPTDISDSAFSMGAPNEKLTTLTFPAGSTFAPNGFFSGYQGLKSVTFAGDVEIGGSDFSNCSSLTTVTFAGTSKVKDSAFSNCPSLTIIAFTGPTDLSSGAFGMGTPNEKLETLFFPAGSTFAPNSFFSGYKALKSVTFGGDVEIGGNDFLNCPALTTVTFAGTSKLNDSAFSKCPNLATIVFTGPTDLSIGAFSTEKEMPNEKLETLSFPAGSTLEPNSFFSGYKALKSVTFGGDVEIGGSDFKDCPALANVIFNGTSKLKGDAFKTCPEIASITFGGATVISTSYNFCEGNTHLTTLVFPAGSVIPKGNHFSGCTALTSVTFCGDIEIGGSDFSGCTALETVRYEGAFSRIEGAFNNCPSATFIDCSEITDKYTVGAGGFTNGTVTIGFSSAKAYTAITLSVFPDEGYRLASLTVKDADNVEIPLFFSESGGSAVFSMPRSNVTVTATFEAITTHTHSYTYSWFSAGKHLKKCSCGDIRYESHTFGSPSVAGGVKTSRCTLCGYEKTETADAHIHTYAAPTYIWSEDLTMCTAYRTCMQCGSKEFEAAYSSVQSGLRVASFSNPAFFRQLKAIPHEHTFSNEWSKNELVHWHASSCGHTVVSDLDEHDYDKGVPVVGGTKYTCETCGYEKTVPEAAKPCEHEIQICRSNGDGTHIVICEDCGTVLTSASPCVYDQAGGTKCVCGADKPLEVSVSVTKKTVRILFWDLNFYTAEIAANQPVKSITYLADGFIWIEGTRLPLTREDMPFFINVTDMNGMNHQFCFDGKTVTELENGFPW